MPNCLLLFMVLKHSSCNGDSLFDKLIDFKIVNDEFFVNGFVFFKEDKQNFMENAKHFSKFFHLIITFFDITSKEKRNCMNAFCTYLKSISFPPK